mmetsp:Transcript_25543/g.60903  ORF Transcript_25543/g.60903 Transcript_25543/m.60903 type:complete len:298 (+) Transcript_25543:4195-5088(+)
MLSSGLVLRRTGADEGCWHRGAARAIAFAAQSGLSSLLSRASSPKICNPRSRLPCTPAACMPGSQLSCRGRACRNGCSDVQRPDGGSAIRYTPDPERPSRRSTLRRRNRRARTCHTPPGWGKSPSRSRTPDSPCRPATCRSPASCWHSSTVPWRTPRHWAGRHSNRMAPPAWVSASPCGSSVVPGAYPKDHCGPSYERISFRSRGRCGTCRETHPACPSGKPHHHSRYHPDHRHTWSMSEGCCQPLAPPCQRTATSPCVLASPNGQPSCRRPPSELPRATPRPSVWHRSSPGHPRRS